MKKRKAIAVLVGVGSAYFKNRSLLGIIQQAKMLGYDVAVFSLFTVTEEKSKFQVGEENIFNLIDYDYFDGIIFIDYTFWSSRLKAEMYERFKSVKDINLVVLDNEGDSRFRGIIADDRLPMKRLTDHLIEHHGLKKIYNLTGIPGFKVTENRLAGYKDSMEEHGLYYDDSYIFAGDYGKYAAEALAENIASGKVEKPEAVVCANDTMAIALMNSLISKGIKVPEDIAVTGYDLCEETTRNTPFVTSYMRADLSIGAECVRVLHEKITGEKPESVCEDSSVFVSGETCGCRKDSLVINSFDKSRIEREEYWALYRTGFMQERLISATNLDELLIELSGAIYMLRGCSKYSLCVNDNWNDFSERDDKFITEGFHETMNQLFVYNRGDSHNGVKFRTADIFPPEMLDDEPTVCYFMPIHFRERSFGYQVLCYNSDEITPDDTIHFWTGNVNVAIEYIRVLERAEIMYNKAFASSIRDGMTGLYNRRGYELYCKEVFKTAQTKRQKLLIAVADLDNLKHINDKYGHIEGDNAITVLSQAIQTCCGNSEYCVRTGGDEFVIVGCYDYDDETPKYYKSRIHGYLNRYNNSSDKPYKIEASTGFFLDYIDEYEDISECQKVADACMYADKKQRKAGRKD